ncbi:MAG: glycine oxidase ThiO [Gallionella sp.]
MQSDFLIVGGGAVGLTSAIALLQAGYKVTLVERGQVGQEASWAGGGILSPLCSWDYPVSVTHLAHRGMAMFAKAVESLHQATGIDPEYQRSGMLVLPPFVEEQARQWCTKYQCPAQSVNVSDYLPAENQPGLLLPDVAQVRNPSWVLALRKQVEMLGGLILEQHEVQSFAHEAGRITALQTKQGKFYADAYIVAAGAWSKQLLGEHGMHIDIRPIRGQILLFKFDAPPFQYILLKKDLYLIPRRDGHVLIGSTLEDVGFDKSTTVEARESLLKRVYEIFPEWKKIQPIKHWAGFRPGSPNNIPTIGRHPNISNLYVNSGHYRYGVTMSLASAELLLNEIMGKAQPFSVEEYRWR